MYRQMVQRVPCAHCDSVILSTTAVLSGSGTGYLCRRCATSDESAVHLAEPTWGQSVSLAFTAGVWLIATASLCMVCAFVLLSI